MQNYLDNGFVFGDGNLWDHSKGGKKLKNKRVKEYDKKFYDNLINDYLSGMSVTECLKKYNIGRSIFMRTLKDYNIEPRGNKGNTYNSGLVYIHNDSEVKRIKPELLETYLSFGWIEGRGTNTEKHKNNLSKSLKGNPNKKKDDNQKLTLSSKQARHRTVNDGKINIIVDVDELDEWLSKPGINRGRVKTNK